METVIPRKELRIFGIGLGVILLLLAALFFWRAGHHPESVWRHYVWQVAGSCGVIFLIFGAAMPARLAPVYRVWMPFAEKVGNFNTQVLLFLTFWLVIGPVAVLRKLTGADDLRLRNREQPTYFKTKEQKPVTIATCRRQF